MKMMCKALNMTLMIKNPEHDVISNPDVPQFIHTAYKDLLSIANLDGLQLKLDSRTLKYAGHVARMGPDRYPNRLLFNDDRTALSRSNAIDYNNTVNKAIERADMHGDWRQLAQNRDNWNLVINKYTSKLQNDRKHRRHRSRRHTDPSVNTPHSGSVPDINLSHLYSSSDDDDDYHYENEYVDDDLPHIYSSDEEDAA